MNGLSVLEMCNKINVCFIFTYFNEQNLIDAFKEYEKAKISKIVKPIMYNSY